EVQGGRVRELEVELRPADLAALGLTPTAVADALAAADRVDGVGRVIDAYQTLPVVVDARPTTAAAIAQLPVMMGPTGPVPVSAVADVREGWADPDVVVSGPDGEGVVLTVARRPGASTVDVVEGVRAAAASLAAALPP